MRLSIGFDPGPQRTAWAVCTEEEGALTFVDWGMVTTNHSEIGKVVGRLSSLRMGQQKTLYVVEQVFIVPGMNNNTIRDTCEAAGAIRWVIQMSGAEPIAATSAKWRRTICKHFLKSRGTPSDKDVAKILALYYGKGLPHRSNTHLRDALGIATFGFWLDRGQA